MVRPKNQERRKEEESAQSFILAGEKPPDRRGVALSPFKGKGKKSLANARELHPTRQGSGEEIERFPSSRDGKKGKKGERGGWERPSHTRSKATRK